MASDNKHQADKCYICEKPLIAQAVCSLELGFMQLKSCKSCVEGGEESIFDAESDKRIK